MSMLIDVFKANLLGGGARPNLFRATINFPQTGGNSVNTSFLCKAANLPGSTIGGISVPFRGRTMNVAGDRTFESWTITVINDTDFAIRDSFERWMNLMNSHVGNVGFTNTPLLYKQDLQVDQLDKLGATIKTYNFVGAFPNAISAIDLSYDTTDTIEEFTVEFQIDYWTSRTTT